MGETEMEPGASEGVKASTMQAAIMGMLVVNVPMLLVSFVMGYGIHYGLLDMTLGTHVKVGLITSFLTVLTHTTTMFYFMGTGQAVKQEVKERNLDTEFLRRARAFKGQFFYMLTFGTLLVMGTAMIGGGAHADLLRPAQEAGRSFFSYLHEGMAILTLVVNMIALIQTPINIAKNNRLMDDVGETRVQQAE